MISLLYDLTASKRKKYGNKATTLGELSRIGVQIPNGFALSVDAYSEFIDFNHFPYKIDDYLAQNENIIDFILKGNFPDRIINILQHYFDSLNVGIEKKSFVVRSSAICEDSESYSMAGVFSSYINLNSFKQLIESIKKCYASLFSDKALSMMIKYGIPLNKLKMGIIVQEFISGSLSGVAFTADTVKMNSGIIIIINSVNSICADYVDGKCSSSQYRLNKSTCEIMSSFVSPSTPQLSKNEIAKLHKEVLHIENSLGYFQDVEWTIKDSNLYILQARPITTFRYRKYPDSWFIYSENDTLMLSEDKALTPLQQNIKTIWHNATCRGLEYSSKGRNGRFKICNGYFFDAVDERDWDKRAKFREWIEELHFDGKNIFQDIQLPQLLSLREELKSFFQKEISSIELENALIKSKQLFELAVEINMSAVDGSIIPLESFEKYCRRFDSSLSKDDFYDLIYGISKLSEERQSVIELSILVKSNTELMKLFDTYSYDEILYYHFCKYG